MNNPIRTFATSVAVLAIAVVANSGISYAEESASDPHAHHREMLKKAPQAESQASDIKLLDHELVTQDGERVRFASDIVGDHIVVMDFVYTTCTTICPALSAIFQQVQDGLATRGDSAARMVSISVDPVRDTPKRIKEYSERLQAGDEWVWLTGDKSSVDEVLRGLGAYTPDFEEHPSIVLVGDPQSGTWKRFFGFPSPNKILAAVDELAAARLTAHAPH